MVFYIIYSSEEEDFRIELGNNQEKNDKVNIKSHNIVPKEINNILSKINESLKKEWNTKFVIYVLMSVKSLMIFCNVNSVISKNISEKVARINGAMVQS